MSPPSIYTIQMYIQTLAAIWGHELPDADGPEVRLAERRVWRSKSVADRPLCALPSYVHWRVGSPTNMLPTQPPLHIITGTSGTRAMSPKHDSGASLSLAPAAGRARDSSSPGLPRYSDAKWSGSRAQATVQPSRCPNRTATNASRLSGGSYEARYAA